MEQHKLDEVLHIATLINKYHTGSLTEQEKVLLATWANSSQENMIVLQQACDPEVMNTLLLQAEAFDSKAMTERILIKINQNKHTVLPAYTAQAGKIQVLLSKYKKHLTIAASLLLLLGASAAWFYTANYQRGRASASIVPAVITPQALAPGGDKAVLTLANGQQISLDSAANGIIAVQHSVNVEKTTSGIISYKNMSGKNAGSVLNTIATPKGGKYELILADGTHVWLNAASSLSYPVAFNSTKRTVSLQGEAYFEVAHNPKQPFVVDINGMQVKVLGTHFNIMGYAGEAAVKTTLIEGAVNVSKNGKAVLLKPGQEAVLLNSTDQLSVQNANVEEALAWVHGTFLFKNADIQSLMRQLARWYNAEVIYVGDLSNIKFSGGIVRTQDIHQLLDILQADGRLQFSISGNRITVSAK